MPTIHLTPTDRQALMGNYRRSPDAAVRLRAHILLLLADGYPWVTVSAVLFCSLDTISRWKQRFEAEGVGAVFGRPRGRKRSAAHVWASLVNNPRHAARTRPIAWCLPKRAIPN